LGFVELALGLKFLSVADQTYHWGILDREVYLAIWIAIFSLLGLYLLGKLKFKHDSDMPYLSVPRLVMAIISFSFVVYMLPGMWGAPLTALSGYMPPMQSQDFVLSQGGAVAQSGEDDAAVAGVKYGDKLELPHGLQGFFDMAQAEAYAAEVGKPLFVDFTGHGCVNCREMEARVWSDERVLKLLREEYVVVALYADDKLKVDEVDWVTTDAGKVLKTLGKINSYYALKNYGVNAQPYYVLQGASGEQLVEPRGYDLDVEAFVDFLQRGVEAYKAQ
jgi:thiol:disulfide interchange protein DsbD